MPIIFLFGLAAVAVIALSSGSIGGGSLPNVGDAGAYAETYRGYAFKVKRVDDWYHGTGWTRRFPKGDPYNHLTEWGGVFDSKEQAIASARYEVDNFIAGKKPGEF